MDPTTLSTSACKEVQYSPRTSSRTLSPIQCESLSAAIYRRERTIDSKSVDDESLDRRDRGLPRLGSQFSGETLIHHRVIMNNRRTFLVYFFKAIQPFRYAALKFIYDKLADLPESSDIDLLIEDDEKANFLRVIRNGPDVERIHLHRKSFVTFVSIFFRDGSYLEIDLLHRFDRKGVIYMDADEVLDQAIEGKEGVRHASDRHNFEYILLFYLLNDSDVPARYAEYFATFSFERRAAIFAHITGKYKVNINVLDELYQRHTRFTKKIAGHISNLPANRFPLKVFSKIRYAADTAGDMIHHRGITITFSGVDGAGKSTMIEEVKTALQSKYRQKTVVLRHRPSVFPILSSFRHGRESAQRKTRDQLPRQGTNTSKVSSFFRFMYYYIDYLIGQYYIFFRYTLRGYTVLYDRYYFDFIIDSKRSNIVLPQRFMKWGYLFIFKPKVNVFLFAPLEVIKSRKNELSDEDINELTTDYKQLFAEFGKSYSRQHYLVINNTNFDETFNRVMKECISAAI